MLRVAPEGTGQVASILFELAPDAPVMDVHPLLEPYVRVTPGARNASPSLISGIEAADGIEVSPAPFPMRR